MGDEQGVMDGIVKSLDCTPETNNTLYVYDTSIKNQVKIKNKKFFKAELTKVGNRMEVTRG